MSDEQNVQNVDIFSMTEEQLIERYRTPPKAAEPEFQLSEDNADYIHRLKWEQYGGDRNNPELMAKAFLNYQSSKARAEAKASGNGYSGRGGVGKQGVTANALGFGGTGSRSRSFSSMTGAKK